MLASTGAGGRLQSSRGHLAENLAAGSLSLNNDEIGGLTSAFDTP
jgi:hypothetical protein